MKLDGKVALITGGTSGIGESCAELFASEGAKVAVVGSSDIAKAEAVTARIEAAGGTAKPYVGDLSRVSEITKLVAAVSTDFGRIDILINSAGVFYPTPAGETSEADYDRMMDINVKGTFFSANEVAPIMKAQGSGCIINISSVDGRQGIARYAAYCSSKFAIVGLTQVLALELGEHGITANAVCPGLTETERLAGMADGLRPEGVDMETYRQQLIADNAAQVPLGRIAQPDDVARTVAFLASDEAAYLSGLAVNVAGGAWLS